MRTVRVFFVAVLIITLAIAARAPQAKADGYPDYRILLNTEGTGIPWFASAVAGKNTGLTAWRSGAVGGMGGISGSHWSFGDGTNADATSEVVWHTYAKPGTYNVSVDVFLSMGGLAWHWEQSIEVYGLLQQPALNLSVANGQTVTFVYDMPTLMGNPTAKAVDFAGPCNGSSYISWTGNTSPYDAPRVSMNNVPYVTAKGLPASGTYNFYACSVGPGRTDPVSPDNPSSQLVISVTAPNGGTANLHFDRVYLLYKVSLDNIVVRPLPKKGGIRLPIMR